MLKNILKLNGAHELSKNEKKSISGGIPACYIQCGPTGGVVVGCLVSIGTKPPKGVCCACY
jgi:hypothetical protein